MRNKINLWKKESFGRIEEKKAQLLKDIQSLDLKEVIGGLNEEWKRRLFLQEEFQRKIYQ